MARPDFIKPGTRVVNNLRLGRALTGEMGLDPPIMSFFCFNTNPVSQAPETNKIVEGLKREDLFTVVSEHFITDTAKYADIILPATMAGEHLDMMFSWGHFYLTLNEQAIAPRGEAISNSELFRRLATAMGFDEPRLHMSDEEQIEHFVQWDAPQMGGIDMAYFRKKGYYHLAVGTPDDRAAARRRQLPDAVGQGAVPRQGRQELRRAALPLHVRGLPARRGCRRVAGLHAQPRGARDQPRSRQALSAQHHLAQEPRVPELVLRE